MARYRGVHGRIDNRQDADDFHRVLHSPSFRRVLTALVAVTLLWLGTVRPVDPVSVTRQSLTAATTADWAFVAADPNLATPWISALPRPVLTPVPIVRVAVGRPPFVLTTIIRSPAPRCGAQRLTLVGVVELRI